MANANEAQNHIITLSASRKRSNRADEKKMVEFEVCLYKRRRQDSEEENIFGFYESSWCVHYIDLWCSCFTLSSVH